MTKKELLEWGLSEEQAGKVLDGLGEGFVTKSRLSEVQAELDKTKETVKERDAQLETLKKSSGDAETMKNQIEALQKENKEQKAAHDAEMKALKIGNAVDLALTGAKAKNHIAAKALLADFLQKAELAEDGSVKGLSDEMKKLTSGKDTAFLFDSAPGKPRGAQAGGSGEAPNTGTDPKDMNYGELCAYLEENPGAQLG